MERGRSRERGYSRESDRSMDGWQTMEDEPEGEPFMDYSGNEWYGPQGKETALRDRWGGGVFPCLHGCPGGHG